MKTLTGLIVALSFSMNAVAQDAPERPKADFPETEIFLFDIALSNPENALSNGKNVTDRAGYDNQPYFTKDSATFLYSRGDDYQTDIYEYDLESGTSTQITDSEATEFSPPPFPDNQSMSFVTNRSNSIWHGTRENIADPEWTLAASDNHEPIGYHAWNHKTGDILYWSQ